MHNNIIEFDTKIDTKHAREKKMKFRKKQKKTSYYQKKLSEIVPAESEKIEKPDEGGEK